MKLPVSVLFVSLVVACASKTDDALEADAASVVPEDEPAVVTHDRELRGAWVSSVFNGTWPSRTGLPATAMEAELVAIFDSLAIDRIVPATGPGNVKLSLAAGRWAISHADRRGVESRGLVVSVGRK